MLDIPRSCRPPLCGQEMTWRPNSWTIRIRTKRRARGLMQTGITVASPRIPATEIVQPMAQHHDKRQPILDGFPPIGFVSRIRRPIGSGAVGAA